MLTIKGIVSGILAAGIALSSAAQASAAGFDAAEKASQVLTDVQQAAELVSEKTYLCSRETYTWEPGDGETYSTVTEYGYDAEGRPAVKYFLDERGQLERAEFTEYFGDTELVQKTEAKRFDAETGTEISAETTVYGLYTNRKAEQITTPKQYAYRCYDETGALTYEHQTAAQINEYGEPEVIETADNGAVCSRIEMTYDANGNRILQIEHSSENGYAAVYKEEYAYDENGNCISLRRWHGDAYSEYLFDSEIRCVYDEQNRLRSEIETNYENDLSVDCTVTDYNENGDMEMVVYTNVDSALDYTNLYIRDEAGRLIEESYNGVRFHSVEYDENGNKVFEYTYGEDGVTVDSRTEYTYDEHGNLVQEKWYNILEDGSEKLQHWSDYEYIAL